MTGPLTFPKPREKRKLKRQPPCHVILLDDDDHTVDYVVHLMQTLFGHPVERGLQIAREVHEAGRCVVSTCTRELAERKRGQIHAFGPDRLIGRCQGGMSAEVEPAA